MKKLIMCLAGLMTAVSLAACTPTQVTESAPQAAKQNPDGITPEMVAESNAAIKREADSAAPVYDVAFIYVPNSDATGLTREEVSLEAMTEQVLVDCLVEKGVLEADTTVNSFDIEGGEKPGPGVSADAVGSGERIGTLDLSGIPESGTAGEVAMLNAIANTFIENYELDKLKLLINGENYESGHIAHEDGDYLEFIDKYEKF
ncbi:MAG: GerMN domain-containing protein [Hungatella sp.]|nr:GerMN domain-containing protein [Hungatella sp.]